MDAAEYRTPAITVGARGPAAATRAHPEPARPPCTGPDDRPVLAAVDRSEPSRHAARWAGSVAVALAAPLLLLHVTSGVPAGPDRHRLPAWLAGLAVAAPGTGAGTCRAETVRGPTEATVADRAAGARLVVVGAPGREAGADPAAIAARLSCPLAVVRGATRWDAAPRTGPVVVAEDPLGGDAVLDLAADLAAGLGAPLLAVSTPAASAAVRSRHAYAVAPRGPRFDRLLRRHPRLAVRGEIVDDAPSAALTDLSAAARVIVVGAGVTPFAGSALRGRVPCPVVVVPAGRPGN